MEDREGFPGRKRNVLAAVRSVRRIFHAEERVYSSLITAKSSSTATLVSCSVRGADSFRVFREGDCVTGIDDVLGMERDGRPGDCCEGAVLVDVRVVGALLSVRECVAEESSTRE